MTNSTLDRFREIVENKRIAVVGIGVSNTPLIKMLVSHGAVVTACDKKSPEQLGDICKQLSELGVALRLGENYLDSIDADIVFKTPGMRRDTPQLIKAEQNGARLTDEMELFFALCPSKIIGVTGSDGKTTTTSLIYNMIKAQGHACHLGGNIGRPLLPDIGNIAADDFCVVELSSFQLQNMTRSPHVAVITNITPNHLDWHINMEEYINAKKNIFQHQNETDILITNAKDKICVDFATLAPGKTYLFSAASSAQKGYSAYGGNIYHNGKILMQTNQLILPGSHNIENFIAAANAVEAFVSPSAVEKVGRTFQGVKHRIEFVRELCGIKYYNDSMASTPTRTSAGLCAFSQKVILIAGGYDKNIPFHDFGKDIVERVKTLILIGKTSKQIKAAAVAAGANEMGIPIYECTSMENAVQTAAQAAQRDDVVILSPACASFDMYKNFDERGEHFKALVKKL